MRIFLTGVACVGKTTIGAKLGGLLSCTFYDLDAETEMFHNSSIEHLQKRFLTGYSFRVEAAKALVHALDRDESQNCVIALPPSGLRDAYWRVVKKARGVIVVLRAAPEDILSRITFYDLDSNLIERHLTPREKKAQLREIEKDWAYFKVSYKRADLLVDITGLDADAAASKVRGSLTPFLEA